MNQPTESFLPLRIAALLIFSFTLSGCGGGSDGGGGNSNGIGNAERGNSDAGNPPPAPLAGDPALLAATIIEDTYVEHDVDPDEYSEDASNRPVLRTSVRIVFHADTTVQEVNDLLNEFSADIIASRAGYPSLVVRIPDPGTLQALETTVADIESRAVVRSVLLSYFPAALALPPNVHKFVFSEATPEASIGFPNLDHHLTVRGAGAWGVQSLLDGRERPTVLLMDYMGDGDPDRTVVDIEPLPLMPDFGFRKLQTCSGSPNKTCLEPNDHGYAMLSIIAATHSAANLTAPEQHRMTGMVPGGVRLGVVDRKGGSQADFTKFATLYTNAAQTTPGTVVVNLSISDKFPTCSLPGTGGIGQCNTKASMQKDVFEFIKDVESARVNGKDRVLFVVAAGNREALLDAGGNIVGFKGSVDTKTQSQWTASSFFDRWSHPVTGETVESLTNVLVVENSDATQSIVLPYEPACIHESSFVGGHIAGIGRDVLELKLPLPSVAEQRNGGSSQATAQVTGVAAYVAAIRPDFSPQQIIKILGATAEPLSGAGSACTTFATSALLVDAYAAVLATDPPNNFAKSSAKARLEILDIFPVETDGDGKFDIDDLRLWAEKLTDPNLTVEDELYSRYDLNGNGRVSKATTDRFDLDISMNPDGAEPTVFSGFIENDFLGKQLLYDEFQVTDAQVVCYYANTELYEHAGMEPSVRDAELEKIKDQCDPCAVAAAPININTKSGFATLQADAPNTCEEKTIDVAPANSVVPPGGTVQFSATVTGLTDASVAWGATGGSIDGSGLYTAGSSTGEFGVTATSVADSGISTTVPVTITSSDDRRFRGVWEGTVVRTVTTTGKVETCADLSPNNPDSCVRFAFADPGSFRFVPDSVEACVFASGAFCGSSKTYFGGIFSGDSFAGEITRIVANGSTVFEIAPGCAIDLQRSDLADGTRQLRGSMPMGTIFNHCGAAGRIRTSEFLLECVAGQCLQ